MSRQDRNQKPCFTLKASTQKELNNFCIQELKKLDMVNQPNIVNIDNISKEEAIKYKLYSRLLIKHNIAFLKKIVNKFHTTKEIKEEMLQEASLEYIRALRTFNVSKNVSFNTFSYIIIQRHLSTFLLHYENAGIHIPKSVKNRFFQYKKQGSNQNETIFNQNVSTWMQRLEKPVQYEHYIQEKNDLKMF
jgi:DNA-directed RNA polymerase sigma subunit (sigma70/sigma32)